MIITLGCWHGFKHLPKQKVLTGLATALHVTHHFTRCSFLVADVANLRLDPVILTGTSLQYDKK